MDFYDATTLMRLVQAVENDPYVSSGAGEALADKVREFIEDEAEMGGWYTELMNAIGEGEITDPLADFTEVSKPGSGIEEVIAIRMGQRREEARSEDGRVTLKGEAQASRAASEKLAEGRDTGSPAREDPSIV